jgi:membrane-bound metal-dependent hydrolase YbcI (DUF457 family)
MPNRKVHIMAGIMSGTAVAGYRARNLTGEDLLLELAGGCLGGLIGGIAPDLFEPAINSWHRSVAHSSSSCLASAGLMQKCATLQQQCRADARRHTQLKLVSQDDWTRFWHAVMAFAWALLSGFIVGVPAGYLSHLVLDSTSPRGIPLFA